MPICSGQKTIGDHWKAYMGEYLVFYIKSASLYYMAP